MEQWATTIDVIGYGLVFAWIGYIFGHARGRERTRRIMSGEK